MAKNKLAEQIKKLTEDNKGEYEDLNKKSVCKNLEGLQNNFKEGIDLVIQSISDAEKSFGKIDKVVSGIGTIPNFCNTMADKINFLTEENKQCGRAINEKFKDLNDFPYILDGASEEIKEAKEHRDKELTKLEEIRQKYWSFVSIIQEKHQIKEILQSQKVS
jgi:DNA-binding ferritin-like protein